MADATDDGDDPAASPDDPEVSPVRRRRSLQREPRPTLRPELLSGRSLQGPQRSWRERLRERRAVIVAGAAVLVLALAVVLGKVTAERTADDVLAQRADELEVLLDDATPEDFLAFGVGVQQEGSLAQTVRDLDGFVNLRATVDQTFIRFQPSGWWAGFTERCLVAVVTSDAVTVSTPKTNCNRVAPPGG